MLTLTLSVLCDVYVRQCTIRADVHIHPGTAGSSEIIIQGRIVSAAKTTETDSLVPCIEVMQGRLRSEMLFRYDGLKECQIAVTVLYCT